MVRRVVICRSMDASAFGSRRRRKLPPMWFPEHWQFLSPWGTRLFSRWRVGPRGQYFCRVGSTRDGLTWSWYHEFTGGFIASWSEPLSQCRGWTDKEVRFVAKSVLSQILAKAKSQRAGQTAADKEFGEECPILHAMMTEAFSEPGTPRQTSSITIFTQEGMWKACVVEKDNDVSLFASSETLWGAVMCLEERLGASVIDWRERGGKRGNGKK